MRILLTMAIAAMLSANAANPMRALNNPGAIEYTPDTAGLEGLDDPPSNGRYCRFADLDSGIAAIAKVLRTYEQRHGLRTVEKIIARYAPPHENPTGAYIVFVSGELGVMADEVFPVTDYAYMRPLVAAIIRFEGIGPFPTNAQIDRGLALAGIFNKGRAQVPVWIYGAAA